MSKYLTGITGLSILINHVCHLYSISSITRTFKCDLNTCLWCSFYLITRIQAYLHLKIPRVSKLMSIFIYFTFSAFSWQKPQKLVVKLLSGVDKCWVFCSMSHIDEYSTRGRYRLVKNVRPNCLQTGLTSYSQLSEDQQTRIVVKFGGVRSITKAGSQCQINNEESMCVILVTSNSQ